MKTRKGFIISLALILLITNSGLAFSVYYCGKKIAFITPVYSNKKSCIENNTEKHKCCKKDSKSNKKCCSKKEINLKDTSEKLNYESFSFEFIVIKSFYRIFLLNFIPKINSYRYFTFDFNSNAPPLYQLFCQLTFYA